MYIYIYPKIPITNQQNCYNQPKKLTGAIPDFCASSKSWYIYVVIIAYSRVLQLNWIFDHIICTDI